ncbi:fimbrial protein [Klebsiella oxytoca]|uniref:fimbrial protein n=1 Tax=Klebsiella oxytoca TaxID=571 RepID=UPI003879CCCA
MSQRMIAITLLAGSGLISLANAADGTINFTGIILESACTISAGHGSQSVVLGGVNKSAFTAAGNTAAPTKFSITLSSCPAAVTSARVTFDGKTDTANSSLLALTPGAGIATGVGIGIYEDNNTTIIPISVHSAAKTLSTTEQTTFNFIAKYVSTAATVTAGPADAVSDFTISYN